MWVLILSSTGAAGPQLLLLSFNMKWIMRLPWWRCHRSKNPLSWRIADPEALMQIDEELALVRARQEQIKPASQVIAPDEATMDHPYLSVLTMLLTRLPTRQRWITPTFQCRRYSWRGSWRGNDGSPLHFSPDDAPDEAHDDPAIYHPHVKSWCGSRWSSWRCYYR